MSLTALEALREKFPRGSAGFDLVEQHERALRRQQGFFESLAAEMRKPHFGGLGKDIYAGILLRAQEAGIYNPEGVS